MTESGLPRSERHTVRVPTEFPRHGTHFERAQHLISIGGPIGFIPWAPATWASLFTAILCTVVWPHNPVAVAVFSGLGFATGVATGTTSERLMGIEDPRNVVIDEIAGQALVFAIVPAETRWLALGGFLLFRLFDIAKVWPASLLERLPGGWGIMADDAVAGLYAAAALYALHRWAFPAL